VKKVKFEKNGVKKEEMSIKIPLLQLQKRGLEAF
jgi:hypothetical protein